MSARVRFPAAIAAVVVVCLAWVSRGAEPPPKEFIRFSGIEWGIKDSGENRLQPGPNWFSPANVTVDGAGKLHLRATSKGGTCVAAEVVSTQSMGYGTYRFTVDSNLDDLAGNLVLGLFTWDDTSAESFHREIDVELGRWNRDDESDAQFVIQPFSIARNVTRFGLTRGLVRSVHTFVWSPGNVSFRSEGILPDGRRLPIHEHIFDRAIPEPGAQQTRINLWCTDSKWNAAGKNEIVIGGFQFEPLRQ